jgi:hypothetical protein
MYVETQSIFNGDIFLNSNSFWGSILGNSSISVSAVIPFNEDDVYSHLQIQLHNLCTVSYAFTDSDTAQYNVLQKWSLLFIRQLLLGEGGVCTKDLSLRMMHTVEQNTEKCLDLI